MKNVTSTLQTRSIKIGTLTVYSKNINKNENHATTDAFKKLYKTQYKYNVH